MVNFSSWQTPEPLSKIFKTGYFSRYPSDWDVKYWLPPGPDMLLHEWGQFATCFILALQWNLLKAISSIWNLSLGKRQAPFLCAETAGNTWQAGGVCSITAWETYAFCAANKHLARNWDCVSVSLLQTFQSLSGYWEVTLLDSEGRGNVIVIYIPFNLFINFALSASLHKLLLALTVWNDDSWTSLTSRDESVAFFR